MHNRCRCCDRSEIALTVSAMFKPGYLSVIFWLLYKLMKLFRKVVMRNDVTDCVIFVSNRVNFSKRQLQQLYQGYIVILADLPNVTGELRDKVSFHKHFKKILPPMIPWSGILRSPLTPGFLVSAFSFISYLLLILTVYFTTNCIFLISKTKLSRWPDFSSMKLDHLDE